MPRPKTKTRKHQRRLRLESLEARHLLAGDVTVMFNDHVAGNGTHVNTTTYTSFGTARGPLKDIDTGEDTPIQLTTAAAGATFEFITLSPIEGSDAYEIFNGFVDMLIGDSAGIRLAGNATYTHTFTGLNPAATYEFVGTAVRGIASATDRWTLITLDGADAFTADHSVGSGLVTSGLTTTEVALWTGFNRSEDTGYVARWSNIRPGVDGTFSITSRQYRGPTPGIGTGDSSDGSFGYGIEAVRLTEFAPNLKAIDSTIRHGDVLAVVPVDITIDFSSNIVAGTIDASDLTIDGEAASAVAVEDSDTLTWTFPRPLAAGQHSISLAEGVMLSTTESIPNQAFNITFDLLGLPSVANTSVTNLTPIGADIGATITNAGGEDPTLRIYWGDNDGGTTASAWDHVIELGTFGTGESDTAVVSPLSELTTYYYRASAENSVGKVWSATSEVFTTPEVRLPAIINTAIGSVGDVTARIHGSVTDTGGEPPVVTVVYGETNAGTVDANSWDNQLEMGVRNSTFSQFLAGLTPETTYFYTVLATNTAGTTWALPVQTFTTLSEIPLSIVINELHVNPNVKTDLVEYVELHNAGSIEIDLGGWALTDAVEYTFPPGTTIGPGGYLVISQDPTAVQNKMGVSSLGPFAGRLSNEGDNVVLRNRLGEVQDRVQYGLGFPWPTVGDDPGYSMELIHPSLDNDLGGSWRSSRGSTDNDQTYFSDNSSWRYFKGTAEPSGSGAWRDVNFNDADWLTGTTAIGYGDGHVVTNLADMQGGYTSVYLRKEFTVENAAEVDQLLLELQYDDGVNVWINGLNVASENVPGVNLAFDAVANGSLENVDFQEIRINSAADILVNGTNVIAVHLVNRSLSGSSDAWFDARLSQSSGGAPGVTPGARNSVFALAAAPQTRQVDHSPQQPKSGEDVVITAKVTDPDGVGSVTLDYQVVEPGDYISLNDPRYQTQWATVSLTDDGMGGDQVAGDDLYSVLMPGSLQQHRHLVRYRLHVTDTAGTGTQLPYADDPTPNFSYFVYDGVPEWKGAVRPGNTSEVTYESELLESLPTYHLITTSQSHKDAQYIPGTTRSSGYTLSEYLWDGTLVYDGEVYDHIHYRARGGVWRYAMGKNMWKFDFNRGQSFQARDDYGRKYDVKWDKLNFSAVIQQGDYNHRGEQGLFESVGFKMFNLAGVESPHTSFLQFRLITGGDENGATQYDGDFQGLYLAIEQLDGNFLDEHDLPDSNFYKMENGTGTLNNQGPTQPTDRSDLDTFLNTYAGPTQSAQWWRDNLDLERYYNYRAIVEGIHHYDIANGKNYFYLNNAETGRWEVHPWDLDLTWANNMFGSGNEPFKSRVADRTEFRAEYRNRLREIRDLLYNTDQGYQLIDEMASFIYSEGKPSIVDADRAMWDYNPILVSSRVNSSKAGHGRYYQQVTTNDFPGMVQIMKNYIVSRGAYIDNTILNDDAQVPNRPQLTYFGPTDHALNELEFQSSAISGGSGGFAAMKWRIAEVSDPTNPNYDPTDRRKYEINATWESEELTSFDNRVTIPATDLEAGHTYRVRVRLKNTSGYWSHWSEPIQFIAGESTTTPLREHLRISEIMYNPAAPAPSEISVGFTNNDDFEFTELVNTSDQVTLDLTGLEFTEGVSFQFTDGTMLGPGERILVVGNQAAFQARYGLGHNIAGEFDDSRLSNSGETISLQSATAGSLLSIDYRDGGLWSQAADGLGASLELVNESISAAASNKYYAWTSSVPRHGTPGSAAVEKPGVIVSEVLSHTDPPLTMSDSIELHNPTGSAIDIGGWHLSDSGANPLKFKIPSGTNLPAGGYLVFDESDFNPTPSTPAANHFALDAAAGDDVWLTIPDEEGGVSQFVDEVHFRAAANGQSLGRLDETIQLLPLSRGTLGCGGNVPYVSPIVISEIMYNPAGVTATDLSIDPNLQASDLEFVELHNATTRTISLTDWRLRGGVDFIFPPDVMLASEETILLLSFNPDNEANINRLAAFRNHYGIDASVRMLGGYSGQLAGGGESLRLEMAGEPPIGDSDFVPWLTSDYVVYDDLAPWPPDADGLGAALARVMPTAWGSAARSWSGSAATPGVVDFLTAMDFDASGLVDVQDIDFLAAALGDPMRSIALDVNQDGAVDKFDIESLVVDNLGSLWGDANLDGNVNSLDLNQVGIHWQQIGCVGWRQGDFDGDNRVTAADLNLLGLHWQQSVNPEASQVPRPPLSGQTPIQNASYNRILDHGEIRAGRPRQNPLPVVASTESDNDKNIPATRHIRRTPIEPGVRRQNENHQSLDQFFRSLKDFRLKIE